MLGDGLQATLLGVRASLEQFPTAVTGVVMSAFYFGLLVGAIYTPRIIDRVGHVRVFGALASIASSAILLHSLFVTPLVWGALRLVSGVCFAGLYVVTESWLNDRASNETRGQLLSLYMIVTYLGVAGGQLLLNLADPNGFALFIISSVLISIALVPLLLSAGPEPRFGKLQVIGMRELLSISPLGVVGTITAGMAMGALFGIGPVYAEQSGLGIRDISLFMTAPVVGCLLLQWPVGHLSDRFDRRAVISAVTWTAGLLPVLALAAAGSTWWLIALMTVFGGLSLPMYAICIAHANDFLEPEQMVAASGGLVLAGGAGAVLGPLAASFTMTLIGPAGFLWSLGGCHLALGLFASYRMIRRRPLAATEPSHYTPATPRASRIALALTQRLMVRKQDRA